MKSSIKSRAFYLIGVAVITVAVFVLSCDRLSKDNETIKIGAIISLTGAGSHLVDLRDGMMMAIEEINSLGGVNGRKIELLIEDSQTDPEEAKKAFERLENGSKKPLIYLSTLSSIGIALAPFADKHQVVLVGANTSAPEFIKDNKWVFRHFSTAAEASKVGWQTLSDLKVRSLGILYQDDPYGKSVLAALEENIAGKGIEEVNSSFHKNDKDLIPQLEALQHMRAIYIVGMSRQVGLAIRQLRQINYPGIIVTSTAGANPKIQAMPQAEGVYTASPIIYNPNFPFAKEFQKKFEAKYQKPFSLQAANGYDFVQIFTGLIEDQEISRQNIKSLFDKGFMYSGVLGEQELKPGDQEIILPLHEARIEDGKLTFLKN